MAGIFIADIAGPSGQVKKQHAHGRLEDLTAVPPAFQKDTGHVFQQIFGLRHILVVEMEKFAYGWAVFRDLGDESAQEGVFPEHAQGVLEKSGKNGKADRDVMISGGADRSLQSFCI